MSLKSQFSNMFVIPQTASTGCFFVYVNTLHETPNWMIRIIHLKITYIYDSSTGIGTCHSHFFARVPALKLKLEVCVLCMHPVLALTCCHWKLLFTLFYSVLVENFVLSTVFPVATFTVLVGNVTLILLFILRGKGHQRIFFYAAVSFTYYDFTQSQMIPLNLECSESEKMIWIHSMDLIHCTSYLKQQCFRLAFGRCQFQARDGTHFFDSSSWFLSFT